MYNIGACSRLACLPASPPVLLSRTSAPPAPDLPSTPLPFDHASSPDPLCSIPREDMIHKPSTRPPRMPATHAICRCSESVPGHPWNAQASNRAFHVTWPQQPNAHVLNPSDISRVSSAQLVVGAPAKTKAARHTQTRIIISC